MDVGLRRIFGRSKIQQFLSELHKQIDWKPIEKIVLENDRPDIPIVCVGRNLVETYFGHYCKRLAGQRRNTYLLNGIPHDEMPKLYRKAKVHVLLSLRESLGLASLEAAVYGANFVVAIHAPVWEYFRDNVFVCDPEDPVSLQQALLDAWFAAPPVNLGAKILERFTYSPGTRLRGRRFEVIKTH